MIAMGEEYERLASETLKISIKNISIPITVIFNTDKYAGDWNGLETVNKIIVHCDTDMNREIKTQLYRYTPYAETLYIDADSIIVKKGIEGIFEKLKENHIVFQRHKRWEKFQRYYEIYRRAMKQFDCSVPIDITIGGFFAFRKTSDTERFFDLWYEYWQDFGCGRDMPPMACAVQNSGIKYSIITRQDDKYFSFGIDENCIAVHRLAGDDLLKYGVHQHKQNKPFDGNRLDWSMVYFDIHQNEWLVKKTNIQLQDKRERKYIYNYMPDLRKGKKDVLDIGCGFGQFLLVCRRYGNKTVGIIPPLNNYEKKIGLNNSDSLDYELFCRERLQKNRISFIECDFSKAIEEKTMPLNGSKFDVINCKHAINLILRKCFNFNGPLNEYKNNGSWIIDDYFYHTIGNMFDLVNNYLKDGGIFFIASLNSSNAKKYSEILKEIALEKGFSTETFRDDHNHLFRRVENVGTAN